VIAMTVYEILKQTIWEKGQIAAGFLGGCLFCMYYGLGIAEKFGFQFPFTTIYKNFDDSAKFAINLLIIFFICSIFFIITLYLLVQVVHAIDNGENRSKIKISK
jgi:hypothetical protein